jgi:acetoin utilization deacetylase AcuC-like enzyme
MKTEIIYSKMFDNHNNPSHPEQAKRTDVMVHALTNSNLIKMVDIIEPELLHENLLHSIHSEEMIYQIKAMSKTKESWVDPDTYICYNDFNTARLAAGGMVKLCMDVINEKADNGFALIRPPGHHATKNRSMGFCIFNNIALGAFELMEKGKKVLIFDLDVHHGNGTQDIFYDSNRVLYQSFHLTPHYPGTGSVEEIGINEGEGYSVNAPLPLKTGQKTIQKLLDEIFKPIASQFKPNIILVSSGFDTHHADLLGGLCVGINFFGDILKQLGEIQPKIVCTLEGGYNLDVIGNCFLSQVSILCNSSIFFEDNIPEARNDYSIISDIKTQMQSYWDL